MSAPDGLAPAAEFDHLTIFHIAAVDGKADQGAYRMPALPPCRAGIDMQAL